jgi:tetratricopeptide (TPR) repeat protein
MLAALLAMALAALPAPSVQAQDAARSRRGKADASAETSNIESDQQRAARSLFDAGTIAFRQLRYEDALESFLQAYKLTLDPVLLFSIGMTYDRLFRLPEAVKAFEDYLKAMPDAPNRPAAEERIRIIREHIDQGEATPAPPPPAPLEQAPPAAAPASETAPRDPGPASDSRGVKVLHPAVFWVGTGVTAALTGAAIWAGVEFSKASKDYDKNPTEELEQEGPKKERRANALIGSAAGVAVITAVIGIFFTDWKGQKQHTAAQQSLIWNAWLGRDTSGVSLSRSF